MKLAIFSLVAIALPLFVIDSATQIQAAIIYIPDFPCAKEIYSFSYSKACSCSDGPESSISTAVITPTSKSHSISSSHSTSSSHPTGSTYSTSSKVSTLGPISTSIRFTTTRNPKPTTTSSSSAKSYTSTSSSISIISTSPIGTVVPTYTGSAPISAPSSVESSCNTGTVQCCNSVEPASSENASRLFSLLGFVPQDANVPVGMDCTPINIAGVGSGGSCNAQTVCCENTQFNGLINIGCSPISFSL
ncbi:hydrophobin 2 [Pyrrhoderma noxium]|uniref:Hydrophobin n=1 Tax=Pyrrhoderma noxium TaxID=2282107 RepID=A0A286U5T0_9AGAM|nr:hydrophobin 2 [Pyrrhoderma noxium]